VAAGQSPAGHQVAAGPQPDKEVSRRVAEHAEKNQPVVVTAFSANSAPLRVYDWFDYDYDYEHDDEHEHEHEKGRWISISE
jgi:hypothetical protein